MSLAAYQANLARLVVDPDFRAAILAGRDGFTGALDDRERRRLAAIVAQADGLALTVKLHRGFRLGKLLAFTPLTCALLGEARVADEIVAFWRRRPPLSFYYAEEASAFCEHLLERAAAIAEPYLVETVSYERAAIVLRESDWRDDDAPCIEVAFEHDPQALLGALGEGRRPGDVARRASVLVGRRVARERIVWSYRDAPDPACRDDVSSGDRGTA